MTSPGLPDSVSVSEKLKVEPNNLEYKIYM